MVIEDVYEELRRCGAVQSSAAFSEHWLGMEKSYLRCLRAKRRKPSAKALATCALRLRRRAAQFDQSSLPRVQGWALRYGELADRCLTELLTTCESAHE